MTEIAQQPGSALPHQTLVEHFAEAASSVLSQIAGIPLEARPTLLEAASDAATVLRIEITGSLQGLCEIVLTAAMSVHFAALLTGEAPDTADEISDDTREAAAELFQQICGNAADRLRRTFGPLELKPQPAPAAGSVSVTRPAPAASGTGHRFVIAREGGALEFELHVLALALPPGPAAAPQARIQSTAPVTAPPDNTSPDNTPPDNSTAAADPAAITVPNHNLNLLLDIELGATMRFGGRQMLLKEIIELCSGSVVQLDRRVEEPVELLIDGRLIAHGEVVVVGGNYGLRITQVANQSDKIACLP